MEGTFACPDCGCLIRPGGLSPGRQVVCDFCGALVEVPFLPRAAAGPRSRPARVRRRGGGGRWWSRAWDALPVWGRVAAVVLIAAIVLVLSDRAVRSLRGASRTRVLGEMLAAVDDAESAGRIGDALIGIEAAVAYAEVLSPPPYGLDALRRRREALSLQDARARLDALGPTSRDVEPSRAVGEALTLLARAEQDPAITPLVPAIRRAHQFHLERWAENDAGSARDALDANEGLRALSLCGRMHESAKDLPPETRRRVEARAEVLAREAISRFGTFVEPIRGRYTLGTPSSYVAPLVEPLKEALRRRGYVPQVAGSPWQHLWESIARFRAVLDLNEIQAETYLESPNRISRIEGRLELRQGDDLLWQERFQGRTQVPLPRAPAYMASRLAVSNRRSPEFERLLYDNARENLAEKLRGSFQTLPPCPGTTHDP